MEEPVKRVSPTLEITNNLSTSDLIAVFMMHFKQQLHMIEHSVFLKIATRNR